MPSKDPIQNLDDLISKASERIALFKSENFKLAGRIRELEAENDRLKDDLSGKGSDSEKVAELEARVAFLEKEREDVRKRVEAASGRLRKLLAAPPATSSGPESEVESVSDAGDEEAVSAVASEEA